MKLKITRDLIRQCILESMVEAMERQKNPTFLDYDIQVGKEKDKAGNQIIKGTKEPVGEYYINFYVPKEWANVVKQNAKFAIYKQAKSGDAEFSIKIEHADGLFDANGNINNDARVPGFRDVKKLEIFYNLICKIKEKLGLPPVKEAFQDILEDVHRKVVNRITSEGLSYATMDTYELWKDMCEKMGQPEVEELIKNLQISYNGLGAIDNQFKMQNQLRALAQAKRHGINITYLATAKNWKQLLNRKVKLGAHPIFLLFPTIGFASKASMQEFADMNGIGSIEGLDPRQKYDLMIKANKKAPNGYFWAVYYDVADTVQIEGEEDVFNNTIGYENNINGTPNQYTRDRLASGGNDRDSLAGELSNKLYGEAGESDSSKAFKAVFELASEMGTLTAASADGSDKANLFAIKKMVEDMAKEELKNQGRIQKAENAIQYVGYITDWVMLLLRLTPTFVTKFPNLSSKDNIIAYNVLAKIVNGVRDKVNGVQHEVQPTTQSGAAALEESTTETYTITMPSFDEFCKGGN